MPVEDFPASVASSASMSRRHALELDVRTIDSIEQVIEGLVSFGKEHTFARCTSSCRVFLPSASLPLAISISLQAMFTRVL